MSTGFVDLHSHVLYGLDDGAKTREDSVAMLRLAAASGTTDIVATPHASGQYAFKPQVIAQRIAELREAVDINLYPGCDFHLQFDNIEDAVAHPDKYTIDHKTYLLVEFPDVSMLHATDEILTRLLDAGMVPVITHPERNGHLQKRLDDLSRWVEDGCCVQVTAASYTGQFGKRATACADELLTRGLTHFVASDGHDVVKRKPTLREAYERLADRWGEESIRPLFVDNPRAALAGEPLEFEPAPAAVKPRKWYQFWA